MNWFRDWEPPVPWATVAQVAGLTFREVYAVRHPSDLEYEAFAGSGPPLLLPGLGRRRPIKPSNDVVHPEYRGDLDRAIETLMPRLVENFTVARTGDGNLVTLAPTGAMTIALREGPFRVLFYATVLAEVEGSPAVLEALNARNQTLLLGRVYWFDGRVMFDHVIPAEPFVPEQLLRVHREMHQQAAELAEELQPIVGGILPG